MYVYTTSVESNMNVYSFTPNLHGMLLLFYASKEGPVRIEN